MKIVYLAAGAAGMYCGSCLHDNTLAAALLRRGEDISLVPTYTPLRTDEPNVSGKRVFFSGINVYLQQKLSLFRHTPRWLDALFDSPWLLSAVARRSSSTQAHQLGDLVVSMLQGESGFQSKELDKLVDWLAAEGKPDVVHLSNSMLLGMAKQIKTELDIPVVCSLSGEDIFLEQLVPPYYDQARTLLRKRSEEVDAFVALNNYYAEFMADYLQTPREKITVIPHGINLDHYEAQTTRLDTRPTIGYLARICHEKGLHVLVDAFIELARRPEFSQVQLRVAGYLGESDRPYLQAQHRKLVRSGLEDRFHFAGEVDHAGKIAFLKSLDLMCLPTVYRESKGLPVLESWAAGTPTVLPDHGTFPELIQATGAGILFPPQNSTSLTTELGRLLQDLAGTREKYGKLALAGVRAHYTDNLMAERTVALYRKLTDSCAAR